MHLQKQSNPIFPGAVVGTIHSPGALDAALRLRKGAVDVLELRVDAFAHEASLLERLEAAVGQLPAPLIVTIRHPSEGGVGDLSTATRGELFKRFLEHASLIDIELRSARQLPDVIEAAQERGIGVILSHHDFQTTPPLKDLEAFADRAREAQCTVFKLAAAAHTARDLAVLLQFLSDALSNPARAGAQEMAFAVMGMAEFGKTSRLVLGRAGSVLNYGFLDKLQVSGQWPAELLKQRLAELSEPQT